MSTVDAGGSLDAGGTKPNVPVEDAESGGCNIGRGGARRGVGLAWLIAFALWIRRRLKD